MAAQREIETDAVYECLTNNAAPCVYDSRFNADLADGTEGGRVIRHNIHVKQGKRLPWVDPCSRKHFKPVGRGARDQDARDRKFLIRELEARGIDNIPDDAKIWELGETYNVTDERLNLNPKRKSENRNRVFGAKKKEPAEESEKEELKAILKDRKVKFHHNSNLNTLKRLVSESEPKK